MNVLDLFSGIGGFSLGLERAGMRTVAFCERDAYCQAVLRKHWPAVPCFDDIHAIDADGLAGLGRIDLVCGGFPCQPFSVAGRQAGKEDDRHLWPEMLRVIALARPAWVIGENVAGLIAMALDDVLADLEGIGYTARTFVIPAAAVGAPHRRDRLWIVATNTNGEAIRVEPGRSSGTDREGSLQPGQHGNAGNASDSQALQRGAIKRDEQDGAIRGAEDVADADSHTRHEGRASDAAQEQGRRDADRSGERQDVGNSNGQGRLQPGGTIGAEWRRPSDPGWWSTEPNVGRVAYGIPRRVDRLRCLGNAVVPQIPEIIGRAIMSSIGRV